MDALTEIANDLDVPKGDLPKQVRWLLSDRDTERERAQNAEADLSALRARLAEAEAREQALREALLAYGAHLPLCNRRLYPGQGYLCQCGWDAARLLGFAAAQPAARPDAGGDGQSG